MEDQERTRIRSPNYPAFGLTTAIERAKALYDRDGKAAVPPVAAVRAWGYNSLNGRSLRVLGALRQYGLVEDLANRNVRLSQLALTILLAPEHAPERRQALFEAARTPPIFAKLIDEYEGQFPSDESMIHKLVAHDKYTGEAAKGLIAALRDTVGLALQGVFPNSSRQDAIDTEKRDERRRLPDQAPKKKEAEMSDGSRVWLDFPLPTATAGPGLLRVPSQVSDKDYALLSEFIKHVLNTLRQSSPVDPPQAEERKHGSEEAEAVGTET